jgi:ADP-heptose:LPS heptosyltransferase
LRILFITATRIGDAVLGTGALRYALERWPNARITLACGPEAVPIFDAVPNLEEIVALKKKPGAGHWIDLWRRTVPRFWSLVIDGRRSAISRLVPHRRLRVMPRKLPGEHTVQQVTRMMGAGQTLDPHIWTSPTHESEAESLIGAGSPVLALAPMANWPGKVWPAERYHALVERITSSDGILPGGRVAVFSAPGERAAALRILSEVPDARRIDVAGKIDLLTAYACLKRCAFFVGNDSALMHMAAASGTPTVGLFGPSKEEHYAPWGELTAVARTTLSFDEIISAPGYDKNLDRSWMETLSVDAAMNTVRGLMARATKAAAE